MSTPEPAREGGFVLAVDSDSGGEAGLERRLGAGTRIGEASQASSETWPL